MNCEDNEGFMACALQSCNIYVISRLKAEQVADKLGNICMSSHDGKQIVHRKAASINIADTHTSNKPNHEG
jgi:hypothetical protein